MPRRVAPLLAAGISLLLLAAASAALGQERPLVAGDAVRISVLDNPDLTTETLVTPAGRIAFPLVGEVEVGGLTPAQAQERIAARLRAGFIKNPLVTLTVVRIPLKVTVFGEFVRAGTIEVPDDATLLEVISLAGGLKPEAGGTLIVKRREPGATDPREAEVQFDVRVSDLTEGRGTARGLRMADGDVVYAPPALFVKVSVLGEFAKTGLLEVPEKATLLEVISLAGGLKPSAGDILVFKRRAPASAPVPRGEEQLEVQLAELLEGRSAAGDFAVESGDSLYVPRASFVYVSGAVKSPGSYKIVSGLTVFRSITLAGGFTSRAAKGRVKILRKGAAGDVEIKPRMDDQVQADDVIVVPESFF